MSIHKTVVRNQGYTRGAMEFVERHDERKNTSYGNEDVVVSQSGNNVHFKVCDGTYLGVFDKMVKDGEISVRGLKLNGNGTKPESSVIAEMVFDVNTEYFDSQYESHGYASAYDFAKAFYAEAYKMAVSDIGGEQYVLSAVMHADERNLTPDQEILIAAIRRCGIDFANTHGHQKSADEMKKAAMSKPMAELFNLQEKEYADRHKLSILKVLSQKESGRGGDSPERIAEQNAEQIHGRKTHASTR